MANTGTSGSLPNEPLAPGTVLQNRYQIEHLLGGGGMGMVYLAHDQRLANRACAVKEMVDHFIDQQQRIEANEYFAREADTLAQLKHSAIPAITDRFDDLNRHYLVMEYVEGRNLEEEIAARGGPLSEGLVIDIARQLCDVLGYLHGSTPPVVYRDMKPSNVMLTPKGRVVLVDFGIARLFKTARKGTMIGTLGFAPPEQYQGVVDPRSDIYSLGATLHYVLTGRDPEKFPPFSFPPVRDLRPEVSTNLAAAIDRALAYQADARPPSIQDFRDMLLYGKGIDDIAGAPGVSSRGGTAGLTLPPEAAEAIHLPRRHRRRKPRVVALAIFFAVVAGGAFGATYVYNNPQLQQQLGVKSFIDSLPWKVEERMAAAEAHPLDFQRMTLQLSTRSGTPMSEPRASFTNLELSNNRYLQWNASFLNRLAGLKGQDEKIEARFYSPSGLQIASSDANRFVGPGEATADFSAVALMPDLGALPAGNYKVGLYVNDQQVAEQAFAVSQDLAALKAAEAANDAEKAREEADKAKAHDEAERLAMLEVRRRKPLQLSDIEFVNTTKSGTPLAGPASSFSAAKVLFVNWRITFENRLFNLDTGQYRIDAAYIAPDGHTLGSVDDIRIVPPSARTATFSGRVGNSAGGAFLPGQYTVNFYLNGQYVAQKKFRVLASNSQPYPASLGSSAGAAPASGGGGGAIDVPTLATGRIDGLAGASNIPMELRLRPQPNGFLHGEMVIHTAGYGATPIQGFIRGNHVEFQVPYGAKTLYFDGRRNADQLNGTFSSTPAGESGTWTTVTN